MRSQTSESVTHSVSEELVHDLRTPLNQVIGYSEMLIEQVQETGNGGLEPDLQKIHSAGLQLLELIDAGFVSSRTNELSEEAGTLGTVPAASHATDPDSGDHSSILRAEPAAGEIGQGYVLVVDDVEANRDVLSRRLKHQGYSVATAENGRIALEMLAAESFDLLLLDIMLPEIDGYEVLKRLKADDGLRHIPVIMISALSDLESVARCIEMGAEDYLPKPFNPLLLKARIGACLEKKRARDRERLLFEQLQQNYKRLQELEKLRDDLTHMIVHDLRTPLTSLIAGMLTLEDESDPDRGRQELVAISIAGGETLLGMINDLLDVDQMESGSMQLDYGPVDAARLIADAVRQVASLSEGKDLAVVTQIAGDLPSFQGDKSKLRRILVNLLGNAIKFTQFGGILTVDARFDRSRRSVVFSVSDTGEGIPAEAFDRIFEKFGQVEARKGGRIMSTGLGLTFCKLATEAHGGHIGIESAMEKGSKFTFSIPLERP